MTFETLPARDLAGFEGLQCVTDSWAMRRVAYAFAKDNGQRLGRGYLDLCTDALLRFLGAIVLHDRVLFPAWNSQLWTGTPESGELGLLAHALLRDVLVGISADAVSDASGRAATTELEALRALAAEDAQLADVVGTRTGESPVTHGAHRYQLLAQALGAVYVPSQDRAQYLRRLWACQHASRRAGTTSQRITNLLDRELSHALLDAEGNDLSPGFEAPGFGALVVSRCASLEELLPAALEVRASTSAVAFRTWLRQLDAATRAGNHFAIATAKRDIDGTIGALRRSLGSAPPREIVKGEFNVLTGSASLTAQLSGLLRLLVPKPYHIVFVEDYLYESAGSGQRERLLRMLSAHWRL